MKQKIYVWLVTQLWNTLYTNGLTKKQVELNIYKNSMLQFFDEMKNKGVYRVAKIHFTINHLVLF